MVIDHRGYSLRWPQSFSVNTWLRLFLFLFQRHCHITILIYGKNHVPDVLFIELFPFSRGHLNSCISQCCIKHIVDVQVKGYGTLI